MHTSKSAPQPTVIAESPRRTNPEATCAHEVATIYPYAGDRFIVSMIFGYSKRDDVETVKQAAKAAYDYVRTASDGTVLHVFDRETGEMHALEEREFVNEPEKK